MDSAKPSTVAKIATMQLTGKDTARNSTPSAEKSIIGKKLGRRLSNSSRGGVIRRFVGSAGGIHHQDLGPWHSPPDGKPSGSSSVGR